MQIGIAIGTSARSAGSARTGIFVDSAAGDDAGDGAQDLPFRTLARAAAEAAAAGNGARIYLVAGSYWREELDLGALDGVLVQGTGDLAGRGLPVIDAADPVPGAWQDAGQRGDGHTHVFSQVLSWAGGEKTFPNLWEEGAALVAASSLAECQATPGSFWTANGVAEGTEGTDVTVYLHPRGSTDPRSDGKSYDYAARRHALKLGDGCTARHVHTRRQTHSDGAFVAGHGVLAEGMLFSGGVKHEALAASGTYRRCVGWHDANDLRTSNIIMEFYAADGTGRSGAYEDCVAVGPGPFRDANLTTQVVNGFGGHTGGPGTEYDLQSYVGVSGRNLATLASAEARHHWLERAHARSCAAMLRATGGPAGVRDAWWQLDEGAVHQPRTFPDIQGALEVDGLRVHVGGSEKTEVFFRCEDVTLARSVVVFETTDDWQYLARDPEALSVTATIVEIAGTRHHAWRNDAPGLPVLGAMADNVYHERVADGFNARIGGVAHAGADAYLAAYPEAGTVTDDPGLVDPAGGDFSLVSPLPNGAGLARFPAFTPIPSSLAEAEAWIVNG